MKTLIFTSIATGVLLAGLVIYTVWFDADDFVWRVFATLGVLFVAQVIGYLVIRDIQEETTGKNDGTIAR